MENSLNLYAKIEPKIGFYEAYDELYVKYMQILKTLKPEGKKFLDFACGNGKFTSILQNCGFDIIGIDKSETMLEKAREQGIQAYNISIFDLEEKFDFILAVSDVLNYFSPEELKALFKKIPELLSSGGYFIFDLNTLHAFSEVAHGLLFNEDENSSLIIDGFFEDDILLTKIVYFEKKGEFYKKEEGEIKQYYIEEDFLRQNLSLNYVKELKVKLFSEDDFDKAIFIFQKA